MIKRIAFAAALTLLSAFALRAQGTISYSLPKTSIGVDVEAVQETFFAGPYAAFAKKYLGVDARTKDESRSWITSVSLSPYVEADQNSRFTYKLGEGENCPQILMLSSQGLVATPDAFGGQGAQWRFPAHQEEDFSHKGISAAYTSKAATLYSQEAGSRAAIQQNMVVEKTSEQKAKEAADMIFLMRKTRVQIVTGDTDATYSGEAMSAAIEEITRLEQEYTSLFLGYSTTQAQKMHFDVIPTKDAKSQMYIAFRLSDNDGLVTADTMSGKPYILEVIPEAVKEAETVVEPQGKKKSKSTAVQVKEVNYRIPAVCTVRLTDGTKSLLQSRVSIYQLGSDEVYPVQYTAPQTKK